MLVRIQNSRMIRWLICLSIVLGTVVTAKSNHPSFFRVRQPMKIGVWITYAKRIEKGNPVAIAKKAKRHGITYLVVKTADVKKTHGKVFWYKYCPKKFFEKLVKECHKRNVKVYGWGFVYGKYPKAEAQMAVNTLKAGADGYVFNAETHFCRQSRYKSVEPMVKPVARYIHTLCPWKRLAVSTFARADKGKGKQFPYVAFGKYCEFWVQSYWRTFAWTPEKTVKVIDKQFDHKFNRWGKTPKRKKSINRVIHTAHAYRKTGTTGYIPASELRRFIKTAYHMGEREVNVWVWDFMGEQHFRVISEFTRPKLIPIKLKSNQIKLSQRKPNQHKHPVRHRPKKR